MGLRPSEALQWSFRNVVAMQHETVKPNVAESVNLTLAAGLAEGVSRSKGIKFYSYKPLFPLLPHVPHAPHLR